MEHQIEGSDETKINGLSIIIGIFATCLFTISFASLNIILGVLIGPLLGGFITGFIAKEDKETNAIHGLFAGAISGAIAAFFILSSVSILSFILAMGVMVLFAMLGLVGAWEYTKIWQEN